MASETLPRRHLLVHALADVVAVANLVAVALLPSVVLAVGAEGALQQLALVVACVALGA